MFYLELNHYFVAKPTWIFVVTYHCFTWIKLLRILKTVLVRTSTLNRVHEKSLWLVLNDHQSTLDEMLDTSNEKTIHQQCTDSLLTEVWKFLNGYFPDIMNNVFHIKQNTCSLWNFHPFATDVPRNNCMLNYVVYGANPLWEILPFDLKNSCLLELLKKKIKNWRCTRCPSQICSRFIADFGCI